MSNGEAGKRVRALREGLALNQRTCALKSGIGGGHLSDIEAGKRALSAATAWRLSRVLGPSIFGLTEHGELLRQIDLGCAQRRCDLDLPEEHLKGFALPGGLRLLVPRELVKDFRNGLRVAVA